MSLPPTLTDSAKSHFLELKFFGFCLLFFRLESKQVTRFSNEGYIVKATTAILVLQLNDNTYIYINVCKTVE